ncbi:MAG: hypothetical protein ABIN89_26715 [Chitinophagaceae bacterium]
MIAQVVLFVILYCFTSVISIALLGDRSLISGNLFKLENIFSLIFSWKFILSMFLAIISRLTFILINNTLLKIPKLANASTTITTFITLIFLVFVVIANHFLLKEKLNLQQGVGAFVILTGVFIMLK